MDSALRTRFLYPLGLVAATVLVGTVAEPDRLEALARSGEVS